MNSIFKMFYIVIRKQAKNLCFGLPFSKMKVDKFVLFRF